MLPLILNILIVIVVFILFFNRINIFSFSLLFFYLLILIGSVFCLLFNLYDPLDNWNYIYLFTFQFIICIYPFLKNKYKVEDIKFPERTRIDLFYNISMLFFIGFIISYFSEFYSNLISGNYFEIYKEMRGEEVMVYSNFLEYVFLQFNSYFTIPSLCVSFVYLTKNNFLKGLSLLLVVLLSALFFSVYLASRAHIFRILILLIVLFIFFRKKMPVNIVKYLNLFLALVLIIFVSIGILISISRFENYSDNLWILDYFGASVLNYNIIVDDTVVFTNGKYLLGDNSAYFYAQGYIENVFLSMFSRWYIDLKYWSIFLCFIPYFILRNNKRELDIADLTVVLTVFIILFMGVLYSQFNINIFVSNVLLYFCLKILLYKKI